MNAFLFNTALMLLSATVVVQFAANSFSVYTNQTAVNCAVPLSLSLSLSLSFCLPHSFPWLPESPLYVHVLTLTRLLWGDGGGGGGKGSRGLPMLLICMLLSVSACFGIVQGGECVCSDMPLHMCNYTVTSTALFGTYIENLQGIRHVWPVYLYIWLGFAGLSFLYLLICPRKAVKKVDVDDILAAKHIFKTNA